MLVPSAMGVGYAVSGAVLIFRPEPESRAALSPAPSDWKIRLEPRVPGCGTEGWAIVVLPSPISPLIRWMASERHLRARIVGDETLLKGAIHQGGGDDRAGFGETCFSRMQAMQKRGSQIACCRPLSS